MWALGLRVARRSQVYAYGTLSADREGWAAQARKPTRTFADLLIECEEDRTLRAVLVGMLKEIDYRTRRPGLT